MVIGDGMRQQAWSSAVIALLLIAISAFIYWLKPNNSLLGQSISDSDKSQNQPLPSPTGVPDNLPVTIATSKGISSENNKASNAEPAQKGFVMPNADWPTRTQNFNGKAITYVFGQGNPAEVALNPDQYRGDGHWQDYVTPATEAYLKAFLTDPNLKIFIDRCGHKMGLDQDHSIADFDMTKGEDLDINKLLLIDPLTGRKQLANDRVFAISQVLASASHQLDGESVSWSCLNGRELEGFNHLHDTFDKMTESYLNQSTDGFYDQHNPNSPGYDIIQRTRREMGIE